MSVLPTKALTLYQPYAWLVVNGYKPIENRPETFSQKTFRGPFWVHAGLERNDEVWKQARELCDRNYTSSFYLPSFDELEFGAIPGQATIVGVHYPRQTLWAPAASVPWHFPDQYGLILSGAQALPKPMPCCGMQGFWHVPDDVLVTLKEVTCG